MLLRFYSDLVWRRPVVTWPISTLWLGWLHGRLTGKHQLGPPPMSVRLLIEPDRHDTLYNLANLIKDDQARKLINCISSEPCDKSVFCFSLA